jgi:2-keto-4-pentenoate hydratase/2-oxohepta-3-ene-1,7-dioic acid hydratase in catechol pathway
MQLVAFERLRAKTPREVGALGAAALGFETLEPSAVGSRRIGALLPVAGGERVVDLNRALAVKLAAGDAGAPECEADALLPAEPLAFVRRLSASQAAAQQALAFVVDALSRYDAPDLESAGVVLERRRVRLVAPVPRPGKVVACAGDAALPIGLGSFLKAPSAIAGPEDELALPADAELEAQGELAVVIGRRARRVAPEESLSCVAGYCVAISVFPRAERARSGLGWSGDGFTPMGPALVSRDEIGDPNDLRLRVRVAGRTLQAGHTKELPVPIAERIAQLSCVMTLEPGDVILSGAPPERREPPRPLRDGDMLEAEIERVGRLAIYVRARRA